MTKIYVGIDIAKSKFDCLLLDGDHQHRITCSNDPTGFLQLQNKIKELGPKKIHAGLESTGRYGNDVAHFLQQQGHTVSVINPKCVKNFAGSKLIRNKTDKADAMVIALFVKETSPAPWIAPSRTQQELQDLTRLLQARKEDHVKEQNRLDCGAKSPIFLREVKQNMKNLERCIERLEAAIAALIKADPRMAPQAKLLRSIDGIGQTTAAIILAELPPVEQFQSASQAAAFAGVTPRVFTSGSSIKGKTRLCKTGNRHLRRSLYLPAITAWRCNPVLRAKAETLEKAGKSKMCIVGALMHHLLRIAFGVLKHGKPFDPAWNQKNNLNPKTQTAETEPAKAPKPLKKKAAK